MRQLPDQWSQSWQSILRSMSQRLPVAIQAATSYSSPLHLTSVSSPAVSEARVRWWIVLIPRTTCLFIDFSVWIIWLVRVISAVQSVSFHRVTIASVVQLITGLHAGFIWTGGYIVAECLQGARDRKPNMLKTAVSYNRNDLIYHYDIPIDICRVCLY